MTPRRSQRLDVGKVVIVHQGLSDILRIQVDPSAADGFDVRLDLGHQLE